MLNLIQAQGIRAHGAWGERTECPVNVSRPALSMRNRVLQSGNCSDLHDCLPCRAARLW